MTLTRRTLLKGAVAAASTSLAAPAIHAQSNETVKIGLILDMNGPYADISGKGTATAAQLAIEDFGGSVLGRKVELLIADHQAKADIASTRAREWFDSRKVDTIQDVTGSAAALAVLSVAKEKDKIVAFSGPSMMQITNELCMPSSVHWAYDSFAVANTVARAVTRKGGKSWFFITADYSGGKDITAQATAALTEEGGKVAGSVLHALGAGDFSSQALQAQSSKAQVIGLASFGNDLVNVVKAAREFGIEAGGPQQLASLLMYINDVHALGLKTSQGMLLCEGFYWDMNDDTRKFARRYYEKVRAMPNMSQAGTYSSTLHYLRAVKAANSTETRAVMAKMRELPVQDFYAAGGVVRADGRMVHDMYLFEVKAPSESKYPWDYYKMVAKIPGDQAFLPLAKSTCPAVRKA
ncbi:ABC transporter substrate-binding protein [soil metagenome]